MYMIFYALIILYSSMFLNLIKYTITDPKSVIHRHWLYVRECAVNKVFAKNPQYYDYYYFDEIMKTNRQIDH